MATELKRMRQLIGTSAEWAANDLVIGAGEFALEKQAIGPPRIKVGDGVKRYSQLGALGRSVLPARDLPGVDPSGATDSHAGLQAALDAGYTVDLEFGIYAISADLVIPDGTGIIGRRAHWNRRIGYDYTAGANSVIKCIGAHVANRVGVRASNTPVGAQGGDFSPPTTDDLLDVTLRDFHIDSNGVADFCFYGYRIGNQAGIGNITVERAVKTGIVHLGCYAADFGVFGAYECGIEGAAVGWDLFGWNSGEVPCFAYRATFLLANNGTANTYVAGGATDLEGSGGRFSVGRGSTVNITSESNKGRACVLSQYNIASGAGGPTNFNLQYIEANGDGPYIDYRTGMDGMRVGHGFLHPGNGTTLLSQNIKIEAKDNNGNVLADAGPPDRGEWLVLERIFGDLSGVGPQVNSNTFRYVVRDCTRKLTFPVRVPSIDDFVATENQVGAAVYFTASAAPTVWNAVNGTLTRTGTGQYLFTFTRPFRTGGQHTPVVAVVLSAALNTSVRLTSLSPTSVTIQTYNSSGVAADTGDRIGFMTAGLLAYVPATAILFEPPPPET